MREHLSLVCEGRIGLVEIDGLMRTALETSDQTILGLLRQAKAMSVAQLSREVGVTATAVRQRLNRLMGEGLVERSLSRSGRGRPSHRYSLTDKGLRNTGTNYGDLAVTLWQEIREIKSPEVRQGLLQRVAKRLASDYADQVHGETLGERMESVRHLMGERNLPLVVERETQFPALTALSCPYPDLAEQDRSICAMERLMYSEILGTGLRLRDCRLDGADCCTFEGS